MTQSKNISLDQMGNIFFARWGRPIAPVVFGVQDKTLVTLKTAIQSLTIIANHEMAETDPELGSNAIVFFLSILG